MLAVAASVLLLSPRKPAPPPHPLSLVSAEAIASIALDDQPLTPGTAAYSAAAALPSRLSSLRPDAADRRWIDMRVLRYALRDGSTLWLQVMPDASGAWVRVTADAPAGAPRTVAARARTIRTLRLRGYHLPTDAIAPLLPWESMGNTGPHSRQQSYPQEQSKTKESRPPTARK